jgi:hypothetical protein
MSKQRKKGTYNNKKKEIKEHATQETKIETTGKINTKLNKETTKQRNT